MGTLPGTGTQADGGITKGFVSKPRRLWIVGLAALIALCAVFSWTTRDAMGHLSFLKNGGGVRGPGEAKTLVDLTPWLTAQALAPLAVSSEEKEDAREAEHLADHEVDQAFASALRTAATQRTVLTPEAAALTARVTQLQALVKDDQARVAATAGPQGAGAAVAASGATNDDAEIAKAQLGLDTDELNDAQQDLARAVGDERARIQQELTAHEAVMQKAENHAGDPGEMAAISTQRDEALASRVGAWIDQRTRGRLLQQAQEQARQAAPKLTQMHQALEAKTEAMPLDGSSNAEPGSSAPGSKAVVNGSATRLEMIKRKAASRQLMTIYDDRIQTEGQLAATYAKWAAQVSLQHRIIVHLIMQSVALIGFILLCQTLADLLIGYWAGRPNLDPRRVHTLRTILRIVVQVIAAGLILVVIFGKPKEIPTILGLATAGLTVALQSYILGFCGWFVLMGKRGIRVGDSVEIDGVGGEVAEIGLFRTMLLETGNWTAKGHPTGRLVAFMNTFAVTGRYFNFSTVGQWMWDEITVPVPESAQTYGVIEAIHAAVTRATETDAASAEAEWKGSARGAALSQFSAAPTMNLRPAGSGVDVVVRYVTRAAGRFETRNRLYQAALDVLRQAGEPVAATEPVVAG